MNIETGSKRVHVFRIFKAGEKMGRGSFLFLLPSLCTHQDEPSSINSSLSQVQVAQFLYRVIERKFSFLLSSFSFHAFEFYYS